MVTLLKRAFLCGLEHLRDINGVYVAMQTAHGMQWGTFLWVLRIQLVL